MSGPTDPTDLAAEIVRETRLIQRVERLLVEGRAPVIAGQSARAYLEEHTARLDALYAALCDRWLETGR